jgi:hypothetical protein
MLVFTHVHSLQHTDAQSTQDHHCLCALADIHVRVFFASSQRNLDQRNTPPWKNIHRHPDNWHAVIVFPPIAILQAQAAVIVAARHPEGLSRLDYAGKITPY